MPLCAKCSKPFLCTCGSSPPQAVGDVVKECPAKKPGAIWVHVTDDRGADVKDIGTKKGEAAKSTDANGLAVFDPLPAGPYEIDLAALSADSLKVYEPPPAPTPRKVTVVDEQISYVAFTIPRKPALRIKVVEKGGPKLFGGTVVVVSETESKTVNTVLATGIADIGRVKAGPYKIKATLSAEDALTHALTLDFGATQIDLTLTAGQEQESVVEAEKINVVAPKIDLEYKLILFDRQLHANQGAGQTKIFPGATYVEVSAVQSNPDHAFTGTGKFEAPNADVFTDEACTKPLAADLTAAELIGAKPTKLWLRGKTAGAFKAKLTLTNPVDRFVKLDTNPKEEDMAVVRLGLSIFQQDIAQLDGAGMQVDPDVTPETTYYNNLRAKVIPPQVKMPDVDKIGEPVLGDAAKPGRLLHAQDGNRFGRAKLVVDKIDPADLVAGTDDYDIVLKLGRGWALTTGADAMKPEDMQGSGRDIPTSGGIKLMTTEFDGAVQNDVSVKISALKLAETILWVQGGTETEQPCDIRLDVGMDRAVAGLPKTVKRNGDWARFTVVKIDTVTLVDTRAPGKAEPQTWDAVRKEFYINMKADPDGRKFKVTAKLTKPLKNVRVYFMLAPNKDNRKAANWGLDMPGTWAWKDVAPALKHLDKTDRKNFLHVFEVTAADGKATKELQLSRFGGDKFVPGAYIVQDSHLAKYVEGQAQLADKKPVVGEEMTVSRKFWTQLIEGGTAAPPAFVSVAPNPGFAGAIGQYDRVKARMEAAPPLQVYPLPPGSSYPRSMFEVGGGAAAGLLISNLNKEAFFKSVAPAGDMPVKIPILLCDAQWDEGSPTNSYDVAWTPAATPIVIPTGRLIVIPYLDGGAAVIAGSIECRADRFLPGWNVGPTVNLTDADITVVGRNAVTKMSDLRVGLPAAIQAFVTANSSAQVRVVGLQLKAAMGPYLGESFGGNILSVYEPTQPVDFQNTIVHELGHFFGHTMTAAEVTAASAAGIPAIPTQYQSWLDINDPAETRGSGSHCNTASTAYVAVGTGRNGRRNGKCVMFESGPIAGSYNRYCDACHPYLLVTNMAK